MTDPSSYITFYGPDGKLIVTVKTNGINTGWVSALLYGNVLIRNYPPRILQDRECLYTLHTLVDRTVNYVIDLDHSVIPMN